MRILSVLLALGALLLLPGAAAGAADGTGSMVASPQAVSASSTATVTFTYTADSAGLLDGEVDVTIPTGWTAPQISTLGGAGFVSSTAGMAGISTTDPMTIQITGLTLTASQTFQISYGDAAAPSTIGPSTFNTREASTPPPSGILTAIGTSPTVQVAAPDGSGSMSVSPGSVSAGSSQALTFTYTAGTGGMASGEVDLKVPSGWTAPQTGSGGNVTSSTGTPAISGSDPRTVQVTGVNLSGGQSFTITYAGATVPSSPGSSDTFSTSEASTPVPTGTVKSIGSSPSVQIVAPDGSGSMVVSPSSVSAGSSQALTFTYTAGTGGMASGEVDLKVPSGWTAPQTGSGGNVTSSTGTPATSTTDPMTIRITGLTLSSGQSFQVTYGPATAPSSPGSAPFSTSEASVASDAPTAIGVSPSVHVAGADGSGSMTVTPSSLPSGSTQSLTFTYTAGAGGMQSGEVDLKVPSGWTAPQTGSSVSSTAGSVGVSSTDPMTIQVRGVTLAAGQTFKITYGGATVPSSPGTSSTFVTSEASTATPTGTVTPLTTTSPSVDIVAPDGSGSISVSPTTVSYGSTQSLTFTYTADPGGMQSGELDLTIPSGWTAPQTASGAGSVSTTNGTVGLSSADPRTIQVKGVTLTGGQSFQITYSGATAQSRAGSDTFTTKEASGSGDAAALISTTQPAVTVTPTDPGPPTQTDPSPGNGQITLHWMPPSNTGGQDITGYTITGTSAGGSIQRTAGPNATSLVVDGLTNGTAYTFTIVAQNANGSSGPSNGETATPATVPGAPTLVGSSAGDRIVEIAWTPTPTANDGGAPITGYDVFRSTTAGQRGGLIATVNSGDGYIDQSVANNTTYYYEVAAVNQAGAGPVSNQLSVTPTAFVPPPTLATTKNIQGHQVTFSAPNQCIRAGKVRGELAVSSHISRAKKLMFSRSTFTVGTLAKKTILRRTPSSLPVKVTMYVQHMAPGGSYPFVATSRIKVGAGSLRTYRFRLRITAC